MSCNVSRSEAWVSSRSLKMFFIVFPFLIAFLKGLFRDDFADLIWTCETSKS